MTAPLYPPPGTAEPSPAALLHVVAEPGAITLVLEGYRGPGDGALVGVPIVLSDDAAAELVEELRDAIAVARGYG